MITLAVDTCCAICSVALYYNEQLLHYKANNTPNNQAEDLISFIEKIICDSEISYHEINNIGVSIGPGSFTGIRIGLAAIQGISIVHHDCNVIGVTTLEAIAIGTNNYPVEALLPAGRSQYYQQCFASFDAIIHNKKQPIIGENNIDTKNILLPNAKSVGIVAINRAKLNLITPAEPLYVRPPSQ